MYETPTKGDLDRNLSTLLHEAHQKARAERLRLTSEFASRGMAQSTSLIGATIGVFDTIHRDVITKAMTVLHGFAARMNLPVAEITGWARPHLENLGNSMLGELPPVGFPAEQQRVRKQYLVVFKQRVDGALRDFEVGFANGVNLVETREPAAVGDALREPERLNLAEGLAIVERHLPAEQAKARLRAAFVQKAFHQSPLYALPYDEAVINWETGFVKIPRRRAGFCPTFSRLEFEAYFFKPAAGKISGASSIHADALELLKAIARATEGSATPVVLDELRDLPMTVDRAKAAFHYLKGKGWIEANFRIFYAARVNSAGHDELAAQSQLGEQGKGAAPAPVDDEPLGEVAITEIRQVVGNIKTQLPTLTLTNSAKADIGADIAQIEAETERPTPRRRFMKLYLESLRDNLAKAAGAGTAAAIITLVALVGGLLGKYFGVF